MKRLWNSSFQSLFYRLKVQLLKILIFIPYGNCALPRGFIYFNLNVETEEDYVAVFYNIFLAL